MKAISLFAGAGGDSIGMRKAGVDVVGFVEIDEEAIRTHLLNMPECTLIGKDIKDVGDTELRPYIGRVDIVFGGFPCQGFSNAGKKNPDDPRNSLFREFVRVVSILQPRIIIGENVPHIESITLEKDASAADLVCRAFEDVGYKMASPQKLLASDFGIPQTRRRCFFVGVKDSPEVFDFSKIPTSSPLPLGSFLERDHIEGGIKLTEAEWELAGVQRYIVLADENIQPSGTPPTNLKKCLKENKLSFGKRASSTHSEVIDPAGLSKTIICTYSRMPRLFVPVINERTGDKYLRPFSIRELKLIQSFPEDFEFVGSETKKVNQIGNAVPPRLAQVIVEELVKQLE